ncbi:penicillin-binding transpeptidase domain-containing protein [Proteinivorax hydrogeniformans]|uniref:Penicillin-binding transpeptidase domain-containing protein n=1 Tax=Proteinivorax hydrogeniformans TaxID=1826727 RepID=A0AAU8HTL0_9FIRM
MGKRKMLIICFVLGVTVLMGCSSEDLNPEHTLESYIESWSNHHYDEMLTLLNQSSFNLVNSQEWVFEKRYQNIYRDLGIDEISVEFEVKDFKEEGIDLDEIVEITYPVNVEMNSLAGEINYKTEVELVKEKDEEDEEKWYVVWHPSHLLKGLTKPTDKIRIQTNQPNRGEIYDRNGEGLAVNGKVLQASIVPEATDDLEHTATQFAQILDLDEDRVKNLANQYSHRPDWAAPIQNLPLGDPRVDKLLEIPGVLVNQIDGRQYPYGDITGHLIGHIGPITAEELEERQGQGYGSSSMIGKNSLELVLEEKLRGVPGAVISVSDENGDNSQVVAESDPVDGEDINLSIDISIQQKLVNALDGEMGAGVSMNPKTGEVLAMVSEPAFDSNLRYLRLPDPKAKDLEDTSILFERRFQNRYSPGSVFKPFTAIMGLEEETLDPEEKLNIQGRRWQRDSSWGGYHITRVSDKVNQVDLNTAMMFSDNIYFAKQALNLGEESLEEWAEKFGFGDTMDFLFPMYTSSLSNDGISSEILLADTGYGQGQMQISPLHLTAMYTTFVNDGTMINPTLLSNAQTEAFAADISSVETAFIVLDSLIEVVENKDGTAYRSNPGHSRKIAGKTGTAELKENFKDKDGDILGWYISFDHEKKDVLTTIMVHNHGSSVAVDMANNFWKTID